MLILNEVSHSYGKRPALSDVSLAISRGITGLVGENGAGKTTLLKICAGIIAPTAGTIRLGSQVIGTREARYCIALMPQEAHLPPRFTALEFVTYLTRMRGEKSRAAERAAEALEAVHLGHRMNDRLGSLSGGMKRRVWLAQALASRAEVLLLDEPSTGLDPRQRAIMVDVLRSISPDRIVILSSHVVEDVAALAQRLVVLADGEVVFHDKTPGSFETSDFLRLVGLGDEL